MAFQLIEAYSFVETTPTSLTLQTAGLRLFDLVDLMQQVLGASRHLDKASNVSFSLKVPSLLKAAGVFFPQFSKRIVSQ
ncbi:MAG: hypothetical protein P8K08_23455 [Fuerstiella sp.]|jgi:hypothetical protein|nr:hypothetical protein [Fuerstiella sp.]